MYLVFRIAPRGLQAASELGKVYATGGPVYGHILLSLGPGKDTIIYLTQF